MPLIVKPNPRRMQAFRDSPSERGLVHQGSAPPVPRVNRRLAIVVGVIVIALVLIAGFLAHAAGKV